MPDPIRRGGIAVVTALLACLVAQPLRSQQASPSGLGVECDVYRAVLDHYPGPLQIEHRAIGTIPFGRSEVVREALRQLTTGVDSALVASYFANNAGAIHSEENPERGQLHPACFAGRRSTTFGGSGSTGSEERGVLNFSRVGFTPDLRHALVHTVYGCGPRCGGGGLWLFVKEQGRWVVKERVRTLTF